VDNPPVPVLASPGETYKGAGAGMDWTLSAAGERRGAKTVLGFGGGVSRGGILRCPASCRSREFSGQWREIWKIWRLRGARPGKKARADED
jgi:hypothetical protein